MAGSSLRSPPSSPSKSSTSTVSGISAEVSIESAGERWTIDGTYSTNGESGYGRQEETSCEAVEGIDFEHKHPCRVRFEGRTATVMFRASLVRADDKLEIGFSTA